MVGSNNYIQLKLFSFTVLVLYSLFFTVQIFFNFDIGVPSTSTANRHAIFLEEKGHSHQSISGQHNREKSKHSKIRLNKRFQPANSPALNPYYVTAPVVFIEKQIIAGYTDPFNASSHLFSSSLRGPPAVVYHFV